MPANPEGLLPVEQRHRDAATRLYPFYNSPGCAEGRFDGTDLVQAFARFEKSLARPGMEEALKYYADQLCEGWCEQSPDCAHFDDCAGCLARRTTGLIGSYTPAALSQVPSQEGK